MGEQVGYLVSGEYDAKPVVGWAEVHILSLIYSGGERQSCSRSLTDRNYGHIIVLNEASKHANVKAVIQTPDLAHVNGRTS